MRKKFGAKTWMYPMPVLIVGTYDENGTPKEVVVCDYIAAMTDRFAIAQYDEIYIPKSWHG